MITLHNKDFTINYGAINTTIEAFVEEERNGLFELSFIMLSTDNLFNYVKEENIVVANANDTLLNQKFRIYMTRKLMNNRVEVFARHISFDLMYDYIDNVSFNNQSCEYALNQLFRNSNFSKHYKGYSDIVNAQNYKMSMANILEAIGGKRGSILDTFGNGAELLRDNENIHILNKRGHDNEVTIEYRKNLTGFELEEDTTDLVTRILPYAKYNDAETSEEITIKADYINSPLINNYSHPYIKAIDYSEKFEDGEIPTVEKLINYAKREFNINKVDQPKQNFKIDFIPLSKCVGYEGLEDKISLCDTVTIIDTRYNINTQAKVIKTLFNVLKNRYESIELGEPKTSLGDIIGSGGDNEPVVGPPGPPGPPGEDGNLGDFPNTLPTVPILESFVYGFANIELRWSFENKIYYQYELYASKVKDFTPNTFDLIFQGQASSYMFQAKPNETWYFKVCAINTYGERTEFSNQVTIATTKIEDLSNYVGEMAIDDALIGTLKLDRGWIGRLNANLLDVKGNFSVTDGNGKRTLDIDSFGNVNLDVTSLKIASKNAATQDYTNNLVNNAKNEVIEDTKTYTDTQINLVNGEILLKASKTEVSNAKDEAINTSNNYTNEVKKELSASIEVTAESITNKVNGLDNKYTEIKQTVDGIDITGIVTFKDLSTSGQTVINGDNITSGTIKGALLQTYADDNTKGVRIAKESMQLNNASLFYETNGGFNIQCKEQMAIGSMNDIYIMPGLNSSGTSTGNGSVVIPSATLRPQNLYVVNDTSVGGNLACNGSVSGSSLSTSGNITASNGNISGGNLYAQGSQIQLSYGYGTVGGFGYLSHYYLTLNGHKLAKPASGSGMYAFCVTNSSGQTGYINAHLSTNTYSSDVVKVVNEEGFLKQSELYEVCETPNGKILVPKIMESSIKTDNIEDVLKNNMCAIDEDGVIHNNINNIVYSLWNMNMELKKEIKDLKSRIG